VNAAPQKEKVRRERVNLGELPALVIALPRHLPGLSRNPAELVILANCAVLYPDSARHVRNNYGIAGARPRSLNLLLRPRGGAAAHLQECRELLLDDRL
jgi:hypothetical protein